MKTKNGFVVKLIKNEHPGWPGPWFSFKRTAHGRVIEDGEAGWRALHSYIGKEAWEEVKIHYRKSLDKWMPK